jgi:hypothetical protein
MSSHMRSSLVVSLVGLAALVGSTAGAQEVAAGPQEEAAGANVTPGSPVSIFGNKGQIAISSEVGATFERTSVSRVDGASTSLAIRPGVDYFVIKGLSLGAFVGVHYEALPSSSSTTFQVGPRVGYDFAFSDHLSIWPRAGVSYRSTKLKLDAGNVGGIATPSSSTSNNAVALNLFAPLVFHTNHYFAGVGPALDTDLSGDAKATTIAVRVTLGGWIF